MPRIFPPRPSASDAQVQKGGGPEEGFCHARAFPCLMRMGSMGAATSATARFLESMSRISSRDSTKISLSMKSVDVKRVLYSAHSLLIQGSTAALLLGGAMVDSNSANGELKDMFRWKSHNAMSMEQFPPLNSSRRARAGPFVKSSTATCALLPIVLRSCRMAITPSSTVSFLPTKKDMTMPTLRASGETAHGRATLRKRDAPVLTAGAMQFPRA